MSSSTLSSFWKEHASATWPGNSRRQSATISSAVIASTVAGSGSVNVVAAKEHLLQRVAPQAEPQCLERDHFLGRDVAEVHRRSELLHEPRLRGLRRCLEDDVPRADGVRDLTDQLGAHAARRVEDA